MSWSNYQVLVLKLQQTFFDPGDVARDLRIKSWVHPTPFSTTDDPDKMVSSAVFTHKGASRIFLTGIDFSTSAEFSGLGDISSIERVAFAGPYTPNLLNKSQRMVKIQWLQVEFKEYFGYCKSDG